MATVTDMARVTFKLQDAYYITCNFIGSSKQYKNNCRIFLSLRKVQFIKFYIIISKFNIQFIFKCQNMYFPQKNVFNLQKQRPDHKETFLLLNSYAKWVEKLASKKVHIAKYSTTV